MKPSQFYLSWRVLESKYSWALFFALLISSGRKGTDRRRNQSEKKEFPHHSLRTIGSA